MNRNEKTGETTESEVQRTGSLADFVEKLTAENARRRAAATTGGGMMRDRFGRNPDEDYIPPMLRRPAEPAQSKQLAAGGGAEAAANFARAMSSQISQAELKVRILNVDELANAAKGAPAPGNAPRPG